MRDWYPLSAAGPFSDLKDLLGGLESEWGSFKCGCHPNCGIGTLMLVEEKTKKAVTVPSILNVDRLLSDIKVVTDSGRKKIWTAAADGTVRPPQPAPRGRAGGPDALEGRADHGRPHRRQARLLREEARLAGASSSSAACGSRTSSTTTSAAPRCASSRTPRRWARSPSARTTRAWAGARSSRRCSRRPRSPSGTRPTAATRSTRAAATFRCRSFRARRCPLPGAPPMPEAAPAAARSTLPVYAAKGV